MSSNLRYSQLTRVVNLRREAYDVYGGRPGHGHSGILGNPFDLLHCTREEAIDGFRWYFQIRMKADPYFRDYVHSCSGKVIGCFCKPLDCHADVIAGYLNDRAQGLLRTWEEVAYGNWIRADRNCICPICNQEYWRHPDHWQVKFLKRLCDGTTVKL